MNVHNMQATAGACACENGWCSRVSLVVSLLVGVSAFVSVSVGQTVSVTGTVTFADGQPASEATVVFGNQQTFKQVRSDASGRYAISDLALGSYGVTATAWSEQRVGSFLAKDVSVTGPLVFDIVLISPTPSP